MSNARENTSQEICETMSRKFITAPRGDNLPVGTLLGTAKGSQMVQYVLNGMDEKLFVPKYMLQLPEKSSWEISSSRK